MKKTIFTGSGVAIVTPMNPDFSINYTILGDLIDWQIDNGTDSIVICGTTGEATTMTDEEHVECIRFAVSHTAGRVPVIAGTGSNDTSYAIWLAKEAKAAGADAQLQVTPYYNKTSQLGLLRHFTQIADATDLPIILYNVPGRTNLNILPETYLELSKHPNVVATKEACDDISMVAKTISLCGSDLSVYTGNDNNIVPILSLGGKGVISVLANIMPQETHQICSLYLEGHSQESCALFLKLLKLTSLLFSDVNPIPVKEALHLMGKPAGPCRMPLVELSDENRDALLAEMRVQGLL